MESKVLQANLPIDVPPGEHSFSTTNVVHVDVQQMKQAAQHAHDAVTLQQLLRLGIQVINDACVCRDIENSAAIFIAQVVQWHIAGEAKDP